MASGGLINKRRAESQETARLRRPRGGRVEIPRRVNLPVAPGCAADAEKPRADVTALQRHTESPRTGSKPRQLSYRHLPPRTALPKSIMNKEIPAGQINERQDMPAEASRLSSWVNDPCDVADYYTAALDF